MTFNHPSTPEMGFSGYSMGFPAPPASAQRDATTAGMAMGQHAPTYRPSQQVAANRINHLKIICVATKCARALGTANFKLSMQCPTTSPAGGTLHHGTWKHYKLLAKRMLQSYRTYS